MAETLAIESTGPALRELLQHLPAGETVSLVDAEGKRVAVVLVVPPAAGRPVTPEEWLAELDAAAERIGRAWKSEKNAVEMVSEMRR